MLSLIKETCAADVSEKNWGEEDCHCVGVGPQPGTTKVNIGGKMVDFPASTGSTRTAWEEDNDQNCQGKRAPDWCSKSLVLCGRMQVQTSDTAEDLQLPPGWQLPGETRLVLLCDRQ